MTDLINKKLTFPQSQITIKINQMIYSAQTKVYLCTDVSNSANSYCLKIMQSRSDDKNSLGIINTEIILLMSLKEASNIVNMVDYTTEEKSNVTFFYILLEYCSNGTLKDYISKITSENNMISESQIWKIALQIATGLSKLHEIKYAHRDLRPENILVTLEGQIKISDFSCATNRFYENINNHNRNEIIFDISKNTSQPFRAPEQVDLYSGYPINEKVDIWSLGILIYTLTFDTKPFYEFSSGEFNQVRKGNLFKEEMINTCNPLLVELLKMLLKINPKERASAAEVISFIEKNVNSIGNIENSARLNKADLAESLINISKKNFNFVKRMSDATAKLFKRHSTQFWILKLTNEALDYPPKFKFIKNLVTKAWQKRQKVVKVYGNISSRPLHFISSVALKSVYVIHHYLFLGPPETIQPKEFNFEDFLVFFTSLWSSRLTSENYDKDDKLKNPLITKFIVSYAEFLKAKVNFHKKYTFIENNFSLDSIIKSNSDISVLIDKKFINDLLSFYSFTYQKLVQIPFSVKNFSKTLDLIIQIFNEELYSMFGVLFYLIVAFKKYNSSSKNQNLFKVYDSHFFEISNKIQENLDKIQKFRNEIKSTNQSLNLNNTICQEYLKNLDNHLKFFPVGEFNLRVFFANDLEPQGITLNNSIGRLVDTNNLDKDYIFAKKRKNTLPLNEHISPSQLNLKSSKSNNNEISSLNNDFEDINDYVFNSKDHDVNNNSNKIRSNSNYQRLSNNNKISTSLKDCSNNPNERGNIKIENLTHRKGNSSVSKIEAKKPFEFTDEKFLHSKKNFDFDSALNDEKNKNDENDFESIFSQTDKNPKPSKPPINKNHKSNSNINNVIPLKNKMDSFSKTPNQIVGPTSKKQEKMDLMSFDEGTEQKLTNINANMIPALNMNTAENISKNLRRVSFDNSAKIKSSITNIIEGNDGENQNKNNIQSLFNHNFFSKGQNPNEQLYNQGMNYNNSNETYVTAISKQPQINTNNANSTNLEKNMEMKVINNVFNEIFESNKSDISNLNNQNMFSNNSEIVKMFTNSSNFQMPNNTNHFNNNFNLNHQIQMNRQSMNYVNNMNVPQQQIQSPIPNKNMSNMNFNNQNNFQNQPNYFNYYQNQMPNNPQMFFQQNPINNIPIQGPMGPFPANQNMIPFNPNNQSMMSNMNMDNSVYDTDKLQRTMNEIDKVYNNSSPKNYNNNPNFVNNNIGTMQNNYNMNNYNFNNVNYPQMNQMIQNNPNKIMNPQKPLPNNLIPINNMNLGDNFNLQMNNNNDWNKHANSNVQNINRNSQEFINNAYFNNSNSPAHMQMNKNNMNNLNPQMNFQNNIYQNQNQNLPRACNNNNFPQDATQNTNNNFNFNINNNDIANQTTLTDNNNIESDDHNSGNPQFNTDVSNINIINIETHINNITLNKEEENIEKIANKFLFEQLSKGNLHWLISSKDIETEKRIGFGGTSDVYKGNYRGTDVAIKKLKFLDVQDENLKEFKREVSSLVMLRHPNLVLFMGAIAEKDNICIVTEYCAGGTLFSILHQKKDLIITWELRLRILYEIAVGMNFLHTNEPPIIHRDLKSLNILLTEKIERPTDNTKIKISDFGLARLIRQFDSGKQQMTGQLGTCHWMAPEVIENKNYTLKADVYSFGIIIWEICSRKTPYEEMTQSQISYYVTVNKGRPDKKHIPPNTPPSIIKLMENCWDAEPSNRPSFFQILDYLKKIKL